MFTNRKVGSRIIVGLIALSFALGLMNVSAARAQGKPSIKIISPTDGQKITTTDISIVVEVSNFVISADHVGMPDKEGEGHIHVMLDGMTMGVLFNFYTTPNFTLHGDGISPGPHKLIFDLASNTHMDMADTAQEVNIDYQPVNPKPAPAAMGTSGSPEVSILSPADGATVGTKFTMELKPTNFTPSENLEGKANIQGYGHYHIFIDMNMNTEMSTSTDMTPMPSSSGEMNMMSMAGMVLMPGSNTFSVDLSAWPAGKHTVTVELVNNDHTPIMEAKSATITVNTNPSAAGSQAGGSLYTIIAIVVLAILAVGGALVWQSRKKTNQKG